MDGAPGLLTQSDDQPTKPQHLAGARLVQDLDPRNRRIAAPRSAQWTWVRIAALSALAGLVVLAIAIGFSS